MTDQTTPLDPAINTLERAMARRPESGLPQTAAAASATDLAARTGELAPEVATLLREIDLTDSQSVLFFGAKAQERLTEVSDQMLEGVRAKDVGPAGAALSEMVTTLKGFDVDGLNPNRKPGFFAKLMGQGRPIARFLEEYEAVRDQIEAISRNLERHKTKLLTDVTSLDRLYQANLDYFRALEQYIAAGEAKLDELDDRVIPAAGRPRGGGRRHGPGPTTARSARRPRRPGAARP